MFGYFGGDLNVTDGRFVYMRSPLTKGYQGVFEYTLMPTHINQFFSVHELQGATLNEPFTFTKECKVLKIQATDQQQPNSHRYLHRLFDLKSDPNQMSPINDPVL